MSLNTKEFQYTYNILIVMYVGMYNILERFRILFPPVCKYGYSILCKEETMECDIYNSSNCIFLPLLGSITGDRIFKKA